MNRNRLVRWGLFAVLFLSFSAASFGQVFISVRVGPPALPVYAQPICPGSGFVWTPGYWNWSDDDGYYWVPGTWVVAPVGLLWTPGYWGWNDGFYNWNAGYWGPHVGFYGGIDYGFGYTGTGYYGGEWRGRDFYYNRSVSNVNVVNVTNVYNKTVIVNNTTRVSYNGGTGGVRARATREEQSAMREHHTEPIPAQREHQQAASKNRELFARVNQGRPAIAATARPADFNSRDIVRAKAAGAPYHAPKMSPKEARGPATAENRPLTPPNANRNNAPAKRPAAPSNAKESPKSNDGFHPFTPPAKTTAPSANRPAENNAKPNAKPAEGNRPFTPPAKRETPSAKRPENGNSNRTEAAARPSENRPNETRPAENRPPAREAAAPKPSRPAAENARPNAAPRPNTARPNASRPNNEARPANAPRPSAPAHEAAPKPAPRPEHNAAPKPSAPKPSAARPSAPPKEKPAKEPK